MDEKNEMKQLLKEAEDLLKIAEANASKKEQERRVEKRKGIRKIHVPVEKDKNVCELIQEHDDSIRTLEFVAIGFLALKVIGFGLKLVGESLKKLD